MSAIVKSDDVRAELTRYAVAGWGEGELWTGGGVVLAHDFRFAPVSDTGAAAKTVLSRSNLLDRDQRGKRNAGRRAGFSCGLIDSELARVSLDTNRCLTPSELVERLGAFLAGAAVAFDDVRLDLGPSTAFQSAVTSVLRAVPRGEVVTYGELAALAGHPGAQRAVGTFCAHNRFMFLVPCHRVVGADGIGAYGSAGIEVKRRLLALEGVAL